MPPVGIRIHPTVQPTVRFLAQFNAQSIPPAPPVDAIDATLGSVLVLENGERVSVDVSVSVLDDYLCPYGHPCIAELCASGNTLVYWINVRTGSVKTEGGVLENHFIEPRSPNTQRMNESDG